MSYERYLEFLGLEIKEEEKPAPPCKTLKEILADGDYIEELPKEDYTVKKVAENIKNFKQFKTETEIISTYNTPKANIIVHQPIPGSEEYIKGRTEFIEGMKLFYQNLVKNGFDWDKAVKQAREHKKLKKYKSI